jgi:RNA polymerase sigma-70 factor (ECF subfamily)
MHDPEISTPAPPKQGLEGLFFDYRRRMSGTLKMRLAPSLLARLDVDDVLSEAFLVAYRKLEKAPSTQVSFAWLHRIVVDRMIETWRREARPCRTTERESPWPEGSSSFGWNLARSDTSPSEAVVRDEQQEKMKKTLEEALNRLGSKDKEIVRLRHYEGLSFKELARALGVTQSAASVRYVRAMRRLKKWAEHCTKEEGNE